MEAPISCSAKAAAVCGHVARTQTGSASSTGSLRSSSRPSKLGRASAAGVLAGFALGWKGKARRRHRFTLQAQKGDSILVLGGGIGGLTLAMRLAQMPWRTKPQVKLIDPKERYVFLPLLIDYATGVVELDELAPLFDELLQEAPGVQHIQGVASEVDWRRREVGLCTDEAKLDFDAVVLASGSLRMKPGEELPGLSRALSDGKALCFRSLSDADALRARLPFVSSVAIIGAGYVGVELAAGLAEVLPDVAAAGQISLFGSRFLPGCEEANQARSAELLEKQGIIRKTGRVISIDDDGLTWSSLSGDSREHHACDLVIVTGALAPPEYKDMLQLKAPLEDSVDQGRAAVDEYLRVAPGVFCLGDASAGTPATGQIAMQQAEVAAWNIYAQLSCLPRVAWRRFKPSALGEFIALGSTEAAGVVEASQMANLLPPALPPGIARLASSATAAASEIQGSTKVDIGGKPASLLRRLAYLYRLPGLRHRLQVAENWLRRSSRASGDISANVLPGL
ncbi:Demethylphylloquinone reductase NdbB [Durusdinium trenchii]|uniref:Demethylphylloquinone reductase NdbB n=1 Tax=Durusdinium trenchii TaxID=1381693 RepID=A0ABP0LZE8_9DINO